MNKINKFIKAYDLTDGQAAKLLGIYPGNLSSMKNGRTTIPPYITVSINLHLDIPAAHQKRLKEFALK